MFDRKKVVVLCDKVTKVTEEALGKRSELHGQLIQWLGEVNRCYEEAENFHASFMGQTQATEAHLLALQTFQEQCKTKSKSIVQKLQTVMTAQSSASTRMEAPAAAVNENTEITDGIMQALGNELRTLSTITKASLGTARDNTQQINCLLGSFIRHYESINDHLMKNVKQLEEEVTEDSHY